MSERTDHAEVVPTNPSAADAAGGSDDDLAALLGRREHSRPNRVTWALLSLLLIAVGFIAGALAFRTWGEGTAPAAFPFPVAGAGVPAGFPAFPGAALDGQSMAASGAEGAEGQSASDVTAGTVTLVDGQTVYVTTASGSVVIVRVPASARVTDERAITLDDLRAGTSVVVRGRVGADGKVTATAVTQSGDQPADHADEAAAQGENR